ncbi:MAG: hypothetical protein M1815_004503 [Lichina confinis]|nr:MAG: hypothetical protein M1815_004503 [Lichina confinis]
MLVFDYAINLLCSPYAHSFTVHFFLGPVPPGLSHEQYSNAPSWIGQQYVFPEKPRSSSARRKEDDGDDGGFGKALDGVKFGIDYSPDVADFQNLIVPVAKVQPLPKDFLEGAVRSSLPLSRAINEHLPREPGGRESLGVCLFLEQELNWRVVIPLRGEIDDVPFRLWVARRPVTDPPNKGPPQIVWSATRGKKGGLQQGELPQMESPSR